MSLPKLWLRYPGLVETVRQDHIKAGAIGGGHDTLHALMVAQYALLIAPDPHLGRMAWVAAMCHNTDRLTSLFPDDEAVCERVRFYLDYHTNFSRVEKDLILEAVMYHHKLNDPLDNQVTVVLKDADRIANLGPNLPVRSGQHYHMLPAYNPHFVVEPDPTAKYNNPKTCLHDIRCTLEWEDWIRLPKAKEIAKPYFDFMKMFVALFERQLRETGLLPYPFDFPDE